MKIAISSTGKTLDSTVELRFGRAPLFIIYDTDTREFTVLDNAANAALGQGAGIQTAQAVAAAGVRKAVSGRFGPKATLALNQAGIELVAVNGGNVRQALEYAENAPNESAPAYDGPGTGMGQGMRAGMGRGPCGSGLGRGRGMGCGRGMGGGGGMGRGMGRGMGGGGRRGGF